MKRIIVCGVALVVALCSSLAYAASVKDFKGSVDKGGSLTFSALRDHGKYTRAGLFELERIPLKCDGGTTTKGHFNTSNAVDVTHRSFHYNFNFGADGTARIAGHFNRKGNKATGTFNVPSVDFAPPHTGCSTNGARDWTAHKQ
jgi:opacity protein-like surface antigen